MMNKSLRFLLNYKTLIGIIFGLVFLQALSQLYLPTLMGNIVDKGVVTGNVSYIWKTGLIMLIVALGGVIVAIISSYYSSQVATGFARDLREAIFSHVSGFSLHEFDQIGTASLITRTTNDVNQIQQATMMILRMTLTAPIMLVGGLIMAMSKDFQLSLVILFSIPFIVLTIFIILKKGAPLFKAVQEKLDYLNRVLRENLTGIRVIRAFTREKSERKRLNQANENLMDVSIKVNRLMAFAMPLMMLFMNITVVLIIWFGSFRINTGAMQIGDLMAFIQYVMLIMFALMMASMMFVIVPRAAVSARRIQEVLALERIEPSEGDKNLTQQSEIKFTDVSFHYPNAEEPALSDISFNAKKGETTAIIGGTGSGKTTLINLIPRFYEVNSGKIEINKININDTSIEKVRAIIGLVPQKTQLFGGTIFENISYGRPNASQEEVELAAKIAQAEEFITSFPDGYETLIEQGGTNLSGGQKQRISIARAIIRKPDIYIFDDSFSALDYKTDANLRTALNEETKNATIIIVAQRVSSVRYADQIIVLDKGRIVGKGTHDELLVDNVIYQEIVASQFGKGELA